MLFFSCVNKQYTQIQVEILKTAKEEKYISESFETLKKIVEHVKSRRVLLSKTRSIIDKRYFSLKKTFVKCVGHSI